MTREEAKALLPIIQAYSEGKTIQQRIQVGYEDEWVALEEPDFSCSPDAYRIKPEPKYRPFKNQEECWKEMLKHQPIGWTKLIGETRYSFIVDVDDEIIYSDAFKECTFADGTPFGIKED